MPLINDAGDVALGPASATHRILPVVVAGKYNTSWMFHLHIRNLQTVDDTMSQVHQFLRSAQYRGSSAVRRGFLFNLFFKTSIHKAEILMVSSAYCITRLIDDSAMKERASYSGLF